MIDVKPVPDTNIVEIRFSGSVTAEEFNHALEVFETAIREHGKIKVLEVIGQLDMPPIPWSKFWDDVKFSIEHMSAFTHAAVVADQDWIRAWVRAFNPLFKAEFKAFKQAELEEARQWLRAGM